MSATLSTSTSFNGGTSPYTCRWLQKSPTATTFSNLGASFTCTAGSLSSVPTGTLSTLGSWSFELQVTDGAATPVTVTSNTVTVTVQAVSTLTAPVISVSPSTIDSGQSATLSTITSFTGGTSPYTCQWLQKAPGATVLSNLGASFICTAGSLPTTPTGTLTTTGTWSLELQVTDSSATAQVATSAAVSVTVNAALGVNTPTANPSTVTSGGSSQLSASFTGGTSPYTCQWLQEAPSTTSFTNLGTSSSCTSPTSISSGTLTTTGAWMFELKVTDSAGTPVTVTSGAVTVTATPVTLDATTTNVSCTPTTVVVNQGSSCTVTVTDTSTTSPTVPTGTVTFTPGGPCTLQPATGPSATCSVPVTPINLAVTPLPVNAVYGGDASHSGSRSNTVNLTVTARSTTTSMTCVPSAVNVGIATTCTVTVTDTDIGGSIPPHGQVTVSSSGTGTFIGSPCNLSGTSATTTCHVTYTPGGTAPRTDKLTADYAPATTHLISSGNFQLGITSQVPPVASFTESATTVPTLTAINFDASASTAPSGTITSYAWDFGDTMTATGVTVSHSYAKAGTYTVMLTVSDSLGHTASASATKTITDRPPTASFTFSPAAPSVGQSVSFDGSGSSDVDGTITSYAWNFGDSSTGSGVTVTHTYTATGTFIVTLTVTDNSGNTGSSSAPIIVSQVSATGGHVKLIGYRAAPGFSIQNLQLDATQTLFAMGKNDGNITVKVYVLFNIKTPSGTSLVLYTQVVQLSPNQVINGRNDTRFSAQFKPMPGSYTVIATIYYSPSSSTRGDPSFKPDNASTKTFTFTVLGARFNGDEALTFAHTFHATSTQTFNAQEVNRANIPLLTRIDITVTNPDGTISSFTSPSFLLNPSQNRKDISFNLRLSNQNGHYCFTATLKYGIDTNGNGVLDNNEILGRGKTVKGCFNVVPNDGLAQNSCDDEDDD
ncbi:MAG: hypothetical protein AUJ07_10565 [Crenarchaeota archaeon 13_1_40CM_3_53_5]|nr:MAG: hypothetical protein AUJ07_10565 [Crenarchaeota archaeon 13_1_40CM_3_53_5]